MEYLIITLFVPIFAFTWVNFLLKPGELLDFLAPFFQKITGNGNRIRYPKLLKITYECEKCIAGQITLWAGLIFPLMNDNYNWILHFISVITSIFIAGILAKSWQTWEK